ncbi:MAG: hypothetical protein Q8O16_00130 [Dehalococcoidia bacterium]|nr:hypothetical protein [Dehalococcoidia bacterium]
MSKVATLIYEERISNVGCFITSKVSAYKFFYSFYVFQYPLAPEHYRELAGRDIFPFMSRFILEFSNKLQNAVRLRMARSTHKLRRSPRQTG